MDFQFTIWTGTFIPICLRRIVVSEDQLCALVKIEVGVDNALQVESVPLVSPPQSGLEGRLSSKLF